MPSSYILYQNTQAQNVRNPILPFAYYTYIRRVICWIERLYKQYGNFVRIVQYELSFTIEIAWRDSCQH